MRDFWDETLLSAISQYVTEVEMGQQPLLSAYIARYPQYAHELADFVAYYHAIEVVKVREDQQETTLSPTSRKALIRAQERFPQFNRSIQRTEQRPLLRVAEYHEPYQLADTQENE